MRLVFMGTPEFAVPALRALVEAGHEVVAVYTQPPRPAGRGQKLTPSPVQHYAEKHKVPVFFPTSLKNPEVQAEFRTHKADAAVVAAYGLLLPKPILEAYPHGCLNIHPSLLPRWRGAAPIHRAVLAGDTETGVCIMHMDEGLDTGPVLMREVTPIPPDATSGDMHDLLAKQGATLLLETLVKLKTLTPEPQPEEGVTYAKKLTKAECPLNWYHTATELANQIRGLAPYPLATTLHGDTVLKIHAATVVTFVHDSAPGTVLDDRLTIACGKGTALRIIALQKPGGRPMMQADFLRGHKVETGEKLGMSN